MHFQPTEDQRALRRAVRELLAARWDRTALRAALDPPASLPPEEQDPARRAAPASRGGDRGTGAGSREQGGSTSSPPLDRELWRVLGEAGVFSLRLPEADGGVGLGLADAAVVFEELGRALVPGPVVATHLAAGLVPGAATGETVVTAAAGALVPWLDAADVVRGEVVDAVAVRSVDPLTPLHRVRPAPPDPVGTLLTAAEQVGSAARTTEMAVRYAGERTQFGRPIGGFQAVKHLCAGMLVRAELARTAVYAAAVTADPVETAGAKLLADEAAAGNARDCLQIFGGMGFTWEADVHLHLKRAWLRAEMWLTADRAEEIQAEALALAL
ncbi:acyl-CoA dehydrogenase [Streptomyces sp. NPDC006208]|uniref:acyl-CoA dehydrogenase family protein n=1 Tax=Streptomyces sp. NPDC006208 TaxID=3156734 RepID=UPI0033B21CCC